MVEKHEHHWIQYQMEHQLKLTFFDFILWKDPNYTTIKMTVFFNLRK